MNEDLLKIRHSASHVLATAVLRLFPDAKLDIGPATENGFYYDFDLEHKFTSEDLAKIEAEMKKIISFFNNSIILIYLFFCNFH